MKTNTIYIALILVFLNAVNSFSAVLEKIEKVEQFSTIQFFLTFDTTPRYTIEQTGRRIDLLFINTTLATTAVLPTEDQNIIRYGTAKSKDLLTISLFLRYLSEKHSISEVDDNKLVLELIPGSIYTKNFKNLERQLDGAIFHQQDQVIKRTPLTDSIYKHNWKSFYSNYEADINIDLEVKLTWPPFPVIQYLPPHYKKNIELLPENLIQAAKNGVWGELNFEIPNLINKAIDDPEKQKLLALTYGEILGRQGDFVGSYKQFYLLAEKYPKELLATFANYLMLLIQAEYADPYLANFELKDLTPEFPPKNGLLPYALLTDIETALATNNLKRMNTVLLKDDVGFPAQSEQLKNMRQADYWYSLNQPVKAAAAYQLLDDKKILHNYPFSLNGYCNTLYQQNKYQEAATCYQTLEQIITDDKELSLVRYRKLMSQSKASNESFQNRFEQLALSAPNQEGGVRGRIKTYDFDMLATDNFETYSYIADSYLKTAQSFQERFTSEEAYFKSGLAYYLAQDSKRSIEVLMTLLREYQSGALRKTAEALLLQVLPIEIQKLSDNDEYEELIILAKKNTDLFTKDWIDNASLILVANAYYQLGLYHEAHRIYFHLISTGTEPTRQKLFPPLIKTAYKAGMYSRVDNYATRYKFNYPEDTQIDQIILYQSKSLFSLGKYQRALNILPNPIPDTPMMLQLAIDINFYNNQYDETLNLLKRYKPENETEIDGINFIKAESLYHTAKKPAADELFKTIPKESKHWPQSIYRQAEYLRDKGKNNDAVKLLKTLIKNTKENHWVKLAKQEIKYIENATID